jgi:hypothetical protein
MRFFAAILLGRGVTYRFLHFCIIPIAFPLRPAPQSRKIHLGPLVGLIFIPAIDFRFQIAYLQRSGLASPLRGAHFPGPDSGAVTFSSFRSRLTAKFHLLKTAELI